jgi:hypothetical protein
MDKEKLTNERFLRICFIDNELLVDVNNDDMGKDFESKREDSKDRVFRVDVEFINWRDCVSLKLHFLSLSFFLHHNFCKYE